MLRIIEKCFAGIERVRIALRIYPERVKLYVCHRTYPASPQDYDRIMGAIDDHPPVRIRRAGRNKGTGRVKRAYLCLIALVVALTAVWNFTPLAGMITADRIAALAHAFASQPWAPLAVVLAYTPACLILFPRPLITLFAVVAFGALAGFAYAIVGILTAALITFVIGRCMDRAKVRQFAGARLNRVSDLLCARGLLAVAAVRLVPVGPFAVWGLVAGAIGVKLWHFTLGTALGMLPGTLAATVFGSQVEQGLREHWHINFWIMASVFFVVVVAFAGAIRWADAYLKDASV